MKIRLAYPVLLLAAVLVAGCDSKDKSESAPAKLPPKKKPPVTATEGTAAESAPEAPGQEAMPSAQKPEPSGKKTEGGNVDFASMAKKVKDTGSLGMPGFSDVDVLNNAMRTFGATHKEPLANFQQLVDAKLIRAVPVPPPGKRYVIDSRNMRVSLADK